MSNQMMPMRMLFLVFRIIVVLIFTLTGVRLYVEGAPSIICFGVPFMSLLLVSIKTFYKEC